MPAKKSVTAGSTDTSRLNIIDAYIYPEFDRASIPTVGIAQYDTVASPETKYEYDPHIDPSLEWAGKKEGSSSQSYWLVGQPDLELIQIKKG